MIGCTKLLCGSATVSEAVKYGDEEKTPAQMLQFSQNYRPVVVWNTTKSCNLSCRHCYIEAEDREDESQLSTEEAESMIDDLSVLGVPVLIFSGGEPLLRGDIFALGELAAQKGLRPVISTNGSLITPETAERIRDAGFKYVGISIDGAESTHDRFRRSAGAFKKAVEGIRNSLKAGNKTGIRFTIHKENVGDLPTILDLAAEEGVPRFCMYHLVFSGRGVGLKGLDLEPEKKREVMDYLIARSLELHKKEIEAEILTTDNHADGVYIYHYVRKNLPERADEVLTLLTMHGGCSAGEKIANIAPNGDVHPCQFWSHKRLGNIREKQFSQIWKNGEDPFLTRLRKKHAYLKGKCGRCHYRELCGGCRIRAEAVSGDPWAEDPGCYLQEAEITEEEI